MADISYVNLPDGVTYNITDLDALHHITVPEYDATSTYAKGDFCTYQGNIYICYLDITTPEAWNNNHWKSVSVDDSYLHSLNPKGAGSFSLNRDPNTAIGTYSFAEGFQSCASGNSSHAEGNATYAVGSSAHSEGQWTSATGPTSHSEGHQTTASGTCSHAEGNLTVANHYAQHVFGAYNVLDPSTATASNRGNYVEIVGNGTSNVRSNARTLDWDGNEVLAGGLKINGTQNVATQVSLTQAEYDALVQAGTVDLVNTIYFITDANAIAGSAAEITYSNTASGLSANTVQGAIDEVVSDIPVNATQLPISGSDSTNIKAYIDFIKPLRYRYVGQLLDSKGGTVKGCGEASITLQGGLARIDFGLMIETADESSNEVWGINRDFFTSLVGKTIIPSYGGVFTYYTSAGVLYGDRHGYCGNFGLLAAPNDKYWKPARIYKLAGSASGYATGTWASGTIGVGVRMVGTCWGTYT